MRNNTVTSLSLGAFFLLATLGCAKPPTIEVTNADNAINAAEQAGAAEYAAADLQAAKDALADAKSKIESKEYKDALASALDAKAKAESALAGVEPGKAAAKAEAEKGVGMVTGELKAIADKAKTLKGAAAAEAKSIVDAAQADWTRVQEDFVAGSYNRVNSAVKAMSLRLEEIAAKVETAAKAAAKKSSRKK